MATKLVHSFNITIAKKDKPKKVADTYTKIGKKCEAVVIKDGNTLKARLINSPVEECSEYRVLALTPESLSLKHKSVIFYKKKDKYNHRVVIMRSPYQCMTSNADSRFYDALSEGVVISGHVVRKDKKHYFNYEQLIALKEYSKNMTDTSINTFDYD